MGGNFPPIFRVSLVDQGLFISGDTLAEHVVRPDLVSQNNRYKDERNHRHDCEGVL